MKGGEQRASKELAKERIVSNANGRGWEEDDEVAFHSGLAQEALRKNRGSWILARLSVALTNDWQPFNGNPETVGAPSTGSHSLAARPLACLAFA